MKQTKIQSLSLTHEQSAKLLGGQNTTPHTPTAANADPPTGPQGPQLPEEPELPDMDPPPPGA